MYNKCGNPVWNNRFFTCRGYIHARETGLYYLQSRYYNPTIGRFINADSQLATGDFTGLNLFAYCGNNPVNRTDPMGDAWWHWAVAAAVVAVAAVAVVVTAGGAAAAITAVTLVANGAAASTTAATVAAGVFIGSATAFAGSAYMAAVSSDSADEFASYGGSALMTTTIGGLWGGISSYFSTRTPKPSSQPANTPACFVAGTLVKTEHGSLPIEQIAIGDLVWAWDEQTGDIALKPVVETYVNETNDLVHVFANGEEIITTPKHPFYSPVKGWTEAAQLRAGDILVLVTGEYVVVEKVQHEILEAPVTVYNFQVQDYHTYYVSQMCVLVHNTCSANGYTTPAGGGGITDSIQVGNTTVTFGHGGRHLVGTHLTTTQVNPVIASDVVSRNLPVGSFLTDGHVSVNGSIIIYTAKVLSDVLINVGTYHIK